MCTAWGLFVSSARSAQCKNINMKSNRQRGGGPVRPPQQGDRAAVSPPHSTDPAGHLTPLLLAAAAKQMINLSGQVTPAQLRDVFYHTLVAAKLTPCAAGIPWLRLACKRIESPGSFFRATMPVSNPRTASPGPGVAATTDDTSFDLVTVHLCQ